MEPIQCKGASSPAILCRRYYLLDPVVLRGIYPHRPTIYLSTSLCVLREVFDALRVGGREDQRKSQSSQDQPPTRAKCMQRSQDVRKIWRRPPKFLHEPCQQARKIVRPHPAKSNKSLWMPPKIYNCKGHEPGLLQVCEWAAACGNCAHIQSHIPLPLAPRGPIARHLPYYAPVLVRTGSTPAACLSKINQCGRRSPVLKFSDVSRISPIP